MEKEKLISISEQDWHFKLIKFVWNIDPKMFKNLCPYFWLMIASIICVPFVLLWVGIKKLFFAFGSGIAWIADLIYDKFLYGLYLDSLTEAELYYMAHANELTKEFAKFTSLKAKASSTLEKAMKRRNLTFETIETFKGAFDREVDKLTKLYEIKNQKQEQRREQRRLKENYLKEREQKIKKKVNNIVNYTKNFFVGLFLLCVIFAGYSITTCVTQFFCWITDITITSWLRLFLHLLVIIAISVIVIIIVLSTNYLYDLYKDDKLSGWKLYICYPFIWTSRIVKYLVDIILTILLGIVTGFIEGFAEFGGIFANYLNASYSDYCPGIDWEEKK